MSQKQYFKWTSTEQALVMQIIQEQLQTGGKINWKHVGDLMQTKTSRQCYDFYTIHKDKKQAKRHYWLPQETDTLLTAATKHNKNWTEIQKLYFPNFSVSQLRNKHNNIILKLVGSSMESNISVRSEGVEANFQLDGIGGEIFTRSRASSLLAGGTLGFQLLEGGDSDDGAASMLDFQFM
ncbi:hypothetical protein SS50377_28570 [Spironucleus salmonicida]|uniref:Myb-like domain-containing protein n=1 Tax=Spironucleus salmonicida TaxID=348837 RepID=V6LBH7_9EUKA|nr:hypothetical protein SS50377_28570 [Spironucleus salmonicida]|eukprot:EST41603.1 Hypothetical protein SS50377_18948 [Spironucleus salmonicida]